MRDASGRPPRAPLVLSQTCIHFKVGEHLNSIKLLPQFSVQLPRITDQPRRSDGYPSSPFLRRLLAC
jgi:hypothetical protein